MGAQGLGKKTLAKDLVQEAILAGHTALFTTAECYTPPVVASGDRKD